MAAYTGSGGKVLIGGGAVDIVATDWSISASCQVAETTELGDTVKTYVSGFIDWTATANSVLETETDVVALVGVAEATMKLYIDADNFFDADGIVDSMTINSGIEDTPRMSLTIVGSDTTGISAGFT